MIHFILKCFFSGDNFGGDKPYNSVMYSETSSTKPMTFLHGWPKRKKKSNPPLSSLTWLPWEKSHLPFFNRKYLLRVNAFNNWWEPSIQRSSDVKTNPTRGKLNPPHQLFALPTARKISRTIAIRIFEVTYRHYFLRWLPRRDTWLPSSTLKIGHQAAYECSSRTAQPSYITIYYHVFRNLLPLPSLCKLF